MTKKKEEKKTKAKAQGGRGSTLQSCNCTSEFQDVRTVRVNGYIRTVKK
jgi:hypothetical protein